LRELETGSCAANAVAMENEHRYLTYTECSLGVSSHFGC